MSSFEQSNSSKPNTPHSSNSTSPSHTMDDINTLLYLEALQRSVENQKNIAQKVEEAYKKYQKRYCEYVSVYSKYVALVKKAKTRKLLLQNQLVEPDFSQAAADAESIIEKLSDDTVTAYVNVPDLERFKKELAQQNKLENLSALRAEIMELKRCTEAIQGSVEVIEAGIDSGVTQALDLSGEELYMKNFPKLNERNM